jgi:hypothetical protein
MFKDHQKKRQVIDVDRALQIFGLLVENVVGIIPLVMANTRFY